MAQKLSQEEQSALAAYRRRQEMIAKKHGVISKLNIVEIIDLRSEPNNVHDSYYGTETRIGLWAQERRRCGSPVTRDSLESALDMLNIEIGNSSHWTTLKSEIEDGAIEEDEDTPLTLLYFPEGDGEPVYVELDPDWITDAFWGEKELNVSPLEESYEDNEGYVEINGRSFVIDSDGIDTDGDGDMGTISANDSDLLRCLAESLDHPCCDLNRIPKQDADDLRTLVGVWYDSFNMNAFVCSSDVKKEELNDREVSWQIPLSDDRIQTLVDRYGLGDVVMPYYEDDEEHTWVIYPCLIEYVSNY